MARLIIRTLERIVSVPGTLDDLKKWWKVLGALFLSVVQWWEKARAWLAGATVSRAEWVATVDMGLWWVGTIAGILAVLMLLAMGWNTYKKYATASGVQGRPEIDASKPTRPFTITLNHNDGTYSIGEGEHRFKIKWGPHNEDTIYLYKVGERGHIALVTDAKEVKDPSSYKKSSKLVIGEGQMAVLQNGHGNWATVKIINVEHEKREVTIRFTPLVPGRSCAPYS